MFFIKKDAVKNFLMTIRHGLAYVVYHESASSFVIYFIFSSLLHDLILLFLPLSFFRQNIFQNFLKLHITTNHCCGPYYKTTPDIPEHYEKTALLPRPTHERLNKIS